MLRWMTGPFREFGIVAGTLYATDRLLQKLSPRLRLYAYEFVAQPIPDKPLLRPGHVKGFEFREIKRDDPEVGLMPARAEIKEQRFERGAVCLGAYRKTTLIGYIWLGFREYEEDEIRCTYSLAEPARSVFDFDVYLFPEHRMGLGFMAIWHGANEHLRNRGVRFTFSRVSRSNLASRRSHARLGARIVGRAIFLQAWGSEWMLSTLSPYLFFSGSSRRRPRLTLGPPTDEA
jgi:hypothetical protein